MITVYKPKQIPRGMKSVQLNDVFFNKFTAELLDDRAADVIAQIDHSELVNKYTVRSRFDGTVLNIDKISTGCKTALNIIYNPDVVFDIRECGENALDLIYSLETGNITCSYPLISFNMHAVLAYEKKEKKIISSYDELKEWWEQ